MSCPSSSLGVICHGSQTKEEHGGIRLTRSPVCLQIYLQWTLWNLAVEEQVVVLSLDICI